MNSVMDFGLGFSPLKKNFQLKFKHISQIVFFSVNLLGYIYTESTISFSAKVYKTMPV